VSEDDDTVVNSVPIRLFHDRRIDRCTEPNASAFVILNTELEERA
jgi:hypothetical protein